jgi:hypothetical protein
MSKSKRIIILISCVMLALPFALMGQGYTQQVGTNGNVDWTQQVVRCVGIGAPNPDLPAAAQRAAALRAAKVDAFRNLLETVKGINLTSETIVENAMVVSDLINTKVEGSLRGYRIVGTPRYMSTGDVEIDVEVSLTGVMLDALYDGLPQGFGGGVLMSGGQLICPTCGQPWPAGKPVPPGVNLIQSGTGAAMGATGGVYTGLIIDATGLGIRPAMAPKVVDERGEEIYGSRYVSREYAVDIGMVGYEKNINNARYNERVADNPLVIKAIKAEGPNKTDVVIANGDAMKIHNAAANMNFLQQCKVMFVLD